MLGPLRTFASVLAVTIALHCVPVGTTVAEGTSVGVATSMVAVATRVGVSEAYAMAGMVEVGVAVGAGAHAVASEPKSKQAVKSKAHVFISLLLVIPADQRGRDEREDGGTVASRKTREEQPVLFCARADVQMCADVSADGHQTLQIFFVHQQSTCKGPFGI